MSSEFDSELDLLDLSDDEFEMTINRRNTFDQVLELFEYMSKDTPEQERQAKFTFDKACELVGSVEQAHLLWISALDIWEREDEEAIRAFEKVLELTRTEKDLETIINHYEGSDCLVARAELRQLFDKADEIGYPED